MLCSALFKRTWMRRSRQCDSRHNSNAINDILTQRAIACPECAALELTNGFAVREAAESSAAFLHV